ELAVRVRGRAGQRAGLVEGARIEQPLEALTHGEAPRLVLARDVLGPAHEAGELQPAFELLDFRLPAHRGLNHTAGGRPAGPAPAALPVPPRCPGPAMIVSAPAGSRARGRRRGRRGGDGMPYKPEAVERLVAAIFARAGCRDAEARTVPRHLADANLGGNAAPRVGGRAGPRPPASPRPTGCTRAAPASWSPRSAAPTGGSRPTRSRRRRRWRAARRSSSISLPA